MVLLLCNVKPIVGFKGLKITLPCPFTDRLLGTKNNFRYIQLCRPFTLTKAKLLLLKLIHLFARKVLLVKKLEIEETKTTYYSTFETDLVKVGLVFSISNFFITKTFLASKWMRKKIPSCSNSALIRKSFFLNRSH